MSICRHCKLPRRLIRRGLCKRCYYTRAIRERYGPVKDSANLGEPTEEELERMIREQLPTMPPWGPDDE